MFLWPAVTVMWRLASALVTSSPVIVPKETVGLEVDLSQIGNSRSEWLMLGLSHSLSSASIRAGCKRWRHVCSCRSCHPGALPAVVLGDQNLGAGGPCCRLRAAQGSGSCLLGLGCSQALLWHLGLEEQKWEKFKSVRLLLSVLLKY